MKIAIMSLFFVLAWSVPCVLVREAQAGNPLPLFDQPVKLDDSGRPLYNSWEKQEYMRKLKARNKARHDRGQQDAGSVSTESQRTKENLAEPTPSSAVINRPMTDEPRTD
ncbi:MAG TPA: hypothetical protein VJC18_06295 [bacterium]|nr:hypothetical protein [bacterium]